MRELFIYYKVAITQAQTLLPVILAMQETLQARHSGLSARLLSRSDEASGDHLTWLEIYAHENGIDDGLQREIESAARNDPINQNVGQRHVEVFTPCR